MKFLVSMIGMNRVAGTREAVEAVLKQSEPLHLVLTNNGSTDGTGAYFDEVKKRHPERVTVFHEDRNTFFQEPNNRAFRIAAKMGIPYFVLQNDDAILPPNGLRMLAQPLDDSPYAAISGPEGGCSALNHDFHGQNGATEYIEGSCTCIKVELVRRHRHNLFWDKLHSIYGEDSELSLFMREKGYTIHKVPFHLPHARSQTVNRTQEVRDACEKAQRENHATNKARWSHYLVTRTFDHPILVKRRYALGDALLATPIIDAIAKSNPCSPIWVQTDVPEVFSGHPNVARCAKDFGILTHDVLVVDLNNSYESQTHRHILECYEDVARAAVTGMGHVVWKTSMHPSKKDVQWAASLGLSAKTVILNTDNGNWPGKNWSKWRELTDKLMGKGHPVVHVGTKSRVAGTHAADLIGKTSLLQLAALCQQSALMISTDSFPMHCAQSVGCPTIGLFGVTRSRYIATQGSKFIAVESPESMENSGLRHRKAGVTYVTEGKECMDAISTEMVMDAVRRIQL